MTPSLGGGPARPGPGSFSGRRIEQRLFIVAERVVLSLVGAMFFVAAFALALRAMTDLWAVIVGSRATAIAAGTAFLDLMLLVLMLVELAYTVVTSFRGSELSAEPFLIVGLIAVIRRILVITVGGVNVSGTGSTAAMSNVESFSSQPVELGILTVIVLVFVCSIALLRARPQRREEPADAGPSGPDARWE